MGPGILAVMLKVTPQANEHLTPRVSPDWHARLRAVVFTFGFLIASTLANAEDMAQTISHYRLEHGLSAVKADPQLTAMAQRQANAMAAAGVMGHDVAGSFASRMAEARLGRAAENIAAGSKTWAETFRLWQDSPGHNANLLQKPADSVGVAMARNEQTRYKTFWAMVIAQKTPTNGHKVAPDNSLNNVKGFICKYLC
jgi:uncharacterized protein YkwD